MGVNMKLITGSISVLICTFSFHVFAKEKTPSGEWKCNAYTVSHLVSKDRDPQLQEPTATATDFQLKLAAQKAFQNIVTTGQYPVCFFENFAQDYPAPNSFPHSSAWFLKISVEEAEDDTELWDVRIDPLPNYFNAKKETLLDAIERNKQYLIQNHQYEDFKNAINLCVYYCSRS
jgi:histone deacetylase complex regulatory component SIN3